MDIITARARIEEELEALAKEIRRDGLLAQVKTWYEDKDLEECSPESCTSVDGEILVLTEGMAEDDGLVVVFTVPAKKGEVKNEALEDELSGFQDAARELIGELNEASDPVSYLLERIEKTDKEAREMMEKFNEEMKKMRRGGIAFAIGVAALALVVMLISLLI